jgi:hypothetical protein
MAVNFTPEQAAALTLAASRRTYQLLRHLDLDDGQGADRLLESVASVDEWLALGISLKTVQDATVKHLESAQRDRCTQEQTALRDLLKSTKGKRVALTEWIFASAELALALMREREPDQAGRLRYYESRARTVFEAEEPGSHIRRAVFGDDLQH